MGPFWGPSWAQKRLQEGSKTRSKCELNFGASWEPFWADFRPHLGPQNGPQIGPRALKIPRSISKTTEGPPRSLQIPPGPSRDPPRGSSGTPRDPPRTRPGPPGRFRADFEADLVSNASVFKPPRASLTDQKNAGFPSQTPRRRSFYRRRVRVGGCPEGLAISSSFPPP